VVSRAALLVSAVCALLVVLVIALPGRSSAAPSIGSVRLEGTGLGVVSFGASRRLTITRIARVLGRPTGYPPSACPRGYTQAAWHDLIAQFVSGRFRGYRYILAGGGNLQRPIAVAFRHVLPVIYGLPGITLGSSLGAVRRAYGHLRNDGSYTYSARSGVTFAFDGPGVRARAYEIKDHVCPAAI
jgi:hypothetical protein